MPLIDDKGRLAGRLNLIDAALLLLLVVLVPLAAMSFRVFRQSPPQIDAVVPASQQAGTARRVRLKGANFRPYLRLFVSRTGEPFAINTATARDTEGRFLVESPDEVEIELPPVTPGSYDLHIFDEAHEVLTRTSAFVIEPPAVTTLRATVRFVALPDVAVLVHPGDRDLFDATGGRLPADTPRAVIEAIGAASDAVSAVDMRMSPSGRTTLAIAGPARTIDARVAIPATQNAAGVWVYRDQTIRPGDAISFETARYSIRGLVVAVPETAPPAEAVPHSGRSLNP